MALTPEEIHNRHHYHKPNETTIPMYETNNKLFEQVAIHIEDALPECREKALVHTKLEEARMWANAAIARNVR